MNDLETVKKHFELTASHESGIVVFKTIMQLLGVNRPATVINPKSAETNLLTTAHNAALQGVWYVLREYLSVDKLMQIEYDSKPVEPITAEKDLNGRDSNSPSATSAKSTSTTTKLKRRDFQSESDKFAKQYLDDLYADATDTADSVSA
jgi:hypothetical protein